MQAKLKGSRFKGLPAFGGAVGDYGSEVDELVKSSNSPAKKQRDKKGVQIL